MPHPHVLIGIPTLNGPERLDRCLASIFKHTNFNSNYGGFSARILVADDGSTDENLKLNKDCMQRSFRSAYLSGFDMLYGHGRTGIAKTWNRIIRHEDEYGWYKLNDVVVLLNDDIEVTEDWLDVLVYSVLNNKKVGMVGLNTYPSSVAQDDKNPPRKTDYREAKLLDGGGSLVAAHGPIFAFHRDAYNRVNGFDERYFVFHEEVDFGVSLKMAGYRHYMASYPICYHMGGATNSEPKNLDASKCLKDSRKQFVEKWGCSIAELRKKFIEKEAFYMTSKPVEWNSQLKVWND